IDASDTSTWNSGAGFEPIGPSRTQPFQGGFDGKGHTVSGLYIDRPKTDYVGLFGYMDFNVKYVRNIGLSGVDVTGGTYTGGLAGNLVCSSSTIENISVTGAVTGGRPGGLASTNWSDIANSYTDVVVTSTANWKAAGFVVENHGGDISDSYVDGDVIGNTSRIGAFLAYNDGTITNSFYNEDSLTSSIGACPSTSEAGFGGCSGQEITAKSDTELGLVATFTSLVSEGLSSAWDFIGGENDDTGIRNLWKMATHPVLTVFTGEADQDGDGVDFSEDCNDQDADAFEVTTYYADTDGDGYGDPASTKQSCGAPSGYVSNADDCNPTDKKVFYRTFFLDGDGDGYGLSDSTTQVCGSVTTESPDGYAAESGDCNDTDSSKYPRQYYQDVDGDGWGLAASAVGVCEGTAPDGYVLLGGDADDADASDNPGATADITIGTDVVTSGVEAIGANLTSVAGGTNFAINNFVHSSGFEPAFFRDLQRIQRTGVKNGYRWIEWDYNGGMNGWDTRATGFWNGATVRFYRLVDENGNPLSYSSSMHDPSGADHVVFLGEAHIPEPNEALPNGGFVIDTADGGEKRMYIDQPITLAYGDYVFVSMKSPYMPAEKMSSRLEKYRDVNHPGSLNLFWADGTTGRLVEHPGTVPQEFRDEDPGDTCLRLEATTSGTKKFGQYVYEGSNDTDLWYSQLHPGTTYRVEAWMRQDGLGDDGHVRFAFEGTGDSHYAEANQRDPWTVTGEWKKFTYDFVAPEYPSEPGYIAHTMNFTGPGTLYVDNWLIYEYDARSGYRPFGPHVNSIDPMLDAFPATGTKPAVRFYPLQYNNSEVGAILGNYADSDFNSTTGDIGTGNNGTIAQSIGWAYETGDSAATRVVPWITVPEEYTENDLNAVVEYLGVPYDPSTDTEVSKPYAYKRYIQRDHDGTPWTAEFREIVIEYGNETWHQGAGGYGWNGFSEPGTINYGGREYGLFAQYMLGEQVQGSDEWKRYGLGDKIKFALGANYITGTTGLTAYGEQAMQQTTAATYLGHANYVGPKWETGDTGSKSFNDHGIQETLVGPVTSSTVQMLIRNAAAARDTLKASDSADYSLTAYEGGPSGYWSGAGTEVDEQYGKSLAMGVAALDAWLYSSLHGYTYQNYLGFQSGNWWTSHTMPEQGGFRPHPGWLALTMRNRYASGETMVSATVNSAPTYLRNGTEIPLVSSYAMRDSRGDYSVFVLSRKLDGTHDDVTFGDGFTPVTLHLPFGDKVPSKVTLHKLARPDGTPADPRDSNRTEENIAIVSRDIDLSNYSADFVVDERTGGESGGMAPGTVYLYTFSFDCDGSDSCTDADSDGYVASDDCNDGDASVHAERTFYPDVDGDGYGTFSDTITACRLPEDPPSGYASKGGDCAPSNGDTYATDTPYYADADRDGYGSGAAIGTACVAPDGYSSADDDCDDTNPLRYPGSVLLSCSEGGSGSDDGDDDDDDNSKRHRHRPIVESIREALSGRSDDGETDLNSGSDSTESDMDGSVDHEALRSLDEATETGDMKVPEISEILFLPEEGVVRFSGTGTPDSDVVLFVHSEARIVKRLRVDTDGNWRYDHRQEDLYLKPGQHEAYVVALDSERGLKSFPSRSFAFELTEKDAGAPKENSATVPVAVIAVIGAAILAAFLYRRRKRSGEAS
ncbi:MAG: hypothetical protein HGB18_04770, partial [Candidatus Moranbacteria bacterium]|nr:hypothetical protein [Candidatus Moranbacteria bacterium]